MEHQSVTAKTESTERKRSYFKLRASLLLILTHGPVPAPPHGTGHAIRPDVRVRAVSLAPSASQTEVNLFGELSDFPFPELISMLGRRTGRLLVEDLDAGQRYVVHVHNGHLRSMSGPHEPLRTEEDVRRHITTLVSATRGNFSFTTVPQALIPQQHNLNLAQLMQTATAEVDELRRYRSQLPHPDTCFELTDAPAGHVPEDLTAFLAQASGHLAQGASAADLVRDLHLPLEDVQLRLLRLRHADVIAPRRAYDTPQAPTGVGQLVSRLIGSLLRRQSHKTQNPGTQDPGTQNPRAS